MTNIIGIGSLEQVLQNGFLEIEKSNDGLFQTGKDGVLHIVTPKDRKVEFIVYADKTLADVKSALGYPAIYPLQEPIFEPPAEIVLMDLDGTSVHSEKFWIRIIEQTTAKLLGDKNFKLELEDEPHVSGLSVSEHLLHCIQKYSPHKSVEEARHYYFEITRFEMNEILEGRGKKDAFAPSPGLKEFLLALKKQAVKIGLVTSGLYEKAWPEIVSAFRTLDLGDPLEFYDAIITAGKTIQKGQTGTLGELSPKPHPWLYAETARIGLGIHNSKRHKVIGLEDSGAGIVSIRLAGFAAIGVAGGNIESSGVQSLMYKKVDALLSALPVILG
jgi:beta-phosphoglucomutase